MKRQVIYKSIIYIPGIFSKAKRTASVPSVFPSSSSWVFLPFESEIVKKILQKPHPFHRSDAMKKGRHSAGLSIHRPSFLFSRRDFDISRSI
jgi:hypothetical protein